MLFERQQRKHSRQYGAGKEDGVNLPYPGLYGPFYGPMKKNGF